MYIFYIYVRTRINYYLVLLCLLFPFFISLSFAAPPAESEDVFCAALGTESQANLNELKSSGGGVAPTLEFVEVKILENAVDISGWEVCFSNNPSKEVCISMGVGNGDWYDIDSTVAPDGTDDNGPVSGPVFNTPTWISYDASNGIKSDEGETILFNSSGEVMDYIRYSNNSGICTNDNKRWDVYPNQSDGHTCGACIDSRDPSQKDFARTDPDGTGGWSNNGDAPTEGSTNDTATGGTGTFGINHDGNASTCLREAVNISVLNAGGNPIAGFSGTVNISTSSNHGDWFIVDSMGSSSDPAQGTLANNTADDGAASYTFNNPDQGTVTLYLSNAHADDLTINVQDPTGTPSSTSSLLSFRDNAFQVTITDSLANVPVAGRDHKIKMQMIRRDPNTGSCGKADGYTGTKNLKAWITRDAADPAGTGPVIGASGELPDTTPGINNLSLDFTLGEVTLFLSTTDVGKYVLNLRDDSRTFATGVDINGNAGPLTIRPFGFDIDSDGKRAADYLDDAVLNGSAGDDSFAPDADGTTFVKAGEDFNATVRAVIWQASDDADDDGMPDFGADLTNNGKTVSFGQENPSELVDITHLVVLPDPPGNNGTFNGGNSLDLNSGAGEINTVFSWDEVGIINLSASLNDNDYMGSGVDVTSTIENFGRFYPDRFVVAAEGSPAFVDECSTGTPFTYMDQTFRYGSPPALTLRALNVSGGTTLNYGQDFWKLVVTDLDRAYTDNAGAAAVFSDVLDNTVTVTGDTDLDGEGTLTLDAGTNGDAFMYSRVAEEGEFGADVDVTFSGFTGNVANTDDLTDSDNVCHDSNDDDVCDDYTISNITGATLRFGRLVIGTAFGSELLPLTPAFQTQYYDAGPGTFVTNANDSCTSIAATDLSLTSPVEGPETDGDVVISSGGSCPGPGNGCTTATMGNEPFVNGDGALEFSAPGAGNTGHADITIDLSAVPLAPHPDMTWLRYDWDDDDGLEDGPYDDDPDGRVTFGVYRGPSDYIYIREPW